LTGYNKTQLKAEKEQYKDRRKALIEDEGVYLIRIKQFTYVKSQNIGALNPFNIRLVTK
jgi:hypothetical protein